MARIMVVGGATLDIVNEVDEYPAEDSEIRASAQRVVRGGNAANTSAMLARLGHEAAFVGALADDASSELICEDLEGLGVKMDYCPRVPSSVTPTSYICLSRKNGSRSIVHYRDLPELSVVDFAQVNLAGFQWVHFEGRHVESLEAMIVMVRKSNPAIVCSLEVEKPRDGIELLFPLVDVLLFSSDYAASRGHARPEDLLTSLQGLPDSVSRICAWGEQGAASLANGQLCVQKAIQLEQVVDTLGAGDVFNAAVIDSLAGGSTLDAALKSGVVLAGRKCQVRGYSSVDC